MLSPRGGKRQDSSATLTRLPTEWDGDYRAACLPSPQSCDHEKAWIDAVSGCFSCLLLMGGPQGAPMTATPWPRRSMSSTARCRSRSGRSITTKNLGLVLAAALMARISPFNRQIRPLSTSGFTNAIPNAQFLPNQRVGWTGKAPQARVFQKGTLNGIELVWGLAGAHRQGLSHRISTRIFRIIHLIWRAYTSVLFRIATRKQFAASFTRICCFLARLSGAGRRKRLYLFSAETAFSGGIGLIGT
jgi:hypothetical protein